jgi:hypothetical protein
MCSPIVCSPVDENIQEDEDEIGIELEDEDRCRVEDEGKPEVEDGREVEDENLDLFCLEDVTSTEDLGWLTT